MPESQLNTNLIRNHFVQQSRAAANEAASRGLERIRKHAPVRKLFRGSTYHAQDQGFRVPKQFRFRAPESTGSIVGRMDLAEGESTRNQRIGHANSEIPVFRFKTRRGSVLVSGDFRRVKNGELVPAEPSVVRQRGQHFENISTAVKVTAAGLRGPNGQPLLTSRGRYEVKSGRATFKTPHSSQERIGGRLKGELRVVPAVYVGGFVWAYVESPTVDPETGYPYPRAQEFGSAHNRPHPFMRPGLHETRSDFVNAVKRHVRAGSQAGVV
jgi:hypothetical protein